MNDKPATKTENQTEPRLPAIRGWRRAGMLAASGFFFGLGVLGALLPVLPATPFLLLTSYFLIRCSPRLNAKLLESRLVGPILTDWQVRGGVRNDVRIQAIVIVLIAVASTIALTGASLIPSVSVASLAAVGIVVILRLPSARDDDTGQ